MKSTQIFLTFIIIALGYFAQAQTYSDTTWERWYGETNRHDNPWHYQHAVHYDNGLLLLTYPDQNPYATLLQKTDANGYLLWIKYFNASFQFAFSTLATTIAGEMYLGGAYMTTSGFENPLIVKLNVCGEIEWCKKLEFSNYSFISDIAIDQQGDVIVSIINNDIVQEERCIVGKFNSNGTLIWRYSIASKSVHPLIHAAYLFGITIDSVNNYFLGGHCIWPDYNQVGNIARWRSLVVKVNENGKEEWLLPFGVDNEIASICYPKFTKTGENSFFAVGPELVSYQPLIFNFSSAGDVLYYINDTILQGKTTYNGITGMFKTDNNVYTGILSYYTPPDLVHAKQGYISFDTLLNVIDYKLDNTFTGPLSIIKSHDDKFTNIATIENYEGTGFSEIYLAKYNADLSFADTIDDTNWVYDSLCDHAIASDTIYLACDPIGIDEFRQPVDKTINELPLKIKANPNPAKNHIQLQLEYSVELKNLKIQVFDINGSEKFLENIIFGTKEILLKTRNWASGSYVVIVRSDGKMVGNTKFVIEK